MTARWIGYGALCVVALGGCGAVGEWLAQGGKVEGEKTREQAQYATYVSRLERCKSPPAADDKAWDSQNGVCQFLAENVQQYIDIKDCDKAGNCAEAAALRDSAFEAWHRFLTASMDRFEKRAGGPGHPSLTRSLVHAQTTPAMLQRIPMDAWMRLIAERKTEEWQGQLTKAGTLAEVARRQGAGSCVATPKPAPKGVTNAAALQMVWTPDNADIYVRCTAPQPFSSYERNRKDFLTVRYYDNKTWNELGITYNPPDASKDVSVDFVVPAALIAKKLDAPREKARAGRKHDLGPWFNIAFTYVVQRITGQRKVVQSDGSVTLQDLWSDNIPAEGTVLYKVN